MYPKMSETAGAGLIGAWAVLLLMSLPRPAAALNFFELEAYPATTEGQGLHEIESLTSFVGDGSAHDESLHHHLLRTSLEYNYGVSDKIDAAMYIDFERANGREPDYAGARARLRGALFDKGRFPIDLGWYLEAEVPRKGPAQLEFEFRPLISGDLGRFTIDLNPGFDLPTVASERRTIEFSYAARIQYRASPTVAPALEFFGGIGQIRDVDSAQAQEHYVFPMLYARPWRGFKIGAGPGFGLTRGSDKVLLKLAIEYEFALP